MSKLVAGRIPKGQDCPFRSRCEIASAGCCKHQGMFHPFPFSCASARGFDLLDSHRERKEQMQQATQVQYPLFTQE